jgi:hypothetical protein
VTKGRRPRIAGAVALVLVAEAGACMWLGSPGDRLRLFVNTLTVQGILLAIAGSFLLVDAPFAAARAVRRGGSGAAPADRGARRPWGLALLVAGSALFAAAAFIWSVGSGG